ncbi:MAG: hypothetical protein U0X76_06620 [Bacteroidia bacterium]
MSISTRSEKLKYFIFLLLIFLSRLPFLSAGYGLDGDSWSVAISANLLHDSHHYVPSRLPGYPVHEFLCAVIAPAGYFGLNLVSALFSTLAVFFFMLILRSLKFKSVFLAATAFAFVPAFYIHSTTTIDYVVSLAFILAALYYLLKDFLPLAGLCLGLAIGTRITAGAMLIPFIILLVKNDGFEMNLKRIVKISLPAILTGAAFYFPLYRMYGSSFFTYYEVPYPSIPKVLYKFSIEVWGIVGVLGIFLSTVIFFLPAGSGPKKFLFPRSINERHVIAWLVAIDLYIIAFLRLPMEAGYLLPIIPFVIMLFGKYLYEGAFAFFCCMLILSTLSCTISPVDRYDAASPSAAVKKFHAGGEELMLDFLHGPVFSYQSRRENGIAFVNELLKSTDTVTVKSVIVCGRWYNQMIVQSGDTSKLKVKIRDYISEPEALYFYAKGFVIYYLPKQEYYNKVMRNVDLDIYRAVPYLNGH